MASKVHGGVLVLAAVAGLGFAAFAEGPKASADSEESVFDLRTAVVLDRETTIPGVAYDATAWGGSAAVEVAIAYTNLTTGAFGVLAQGLDGAGVLDLNLPTKDGDYLLTHSAGELTSFATFTMTGYPDQKLHLPAAPEHYSYVVSNETAAVELEGEVLEDDRIFMISYGDAVKVYFAADEEYELVGEFDNPLAFASVTNEVTVGGSMLPTSESLVAAREAAKDAVEAAAGETPWSETMEGIVAEAGAAIDASKTLADIASAKDAGVLAAETQYGIELAAAKAEAKEAIETAAGEMPWSEAMEAVVAEAEQALDEATTLTEAAAKRGEGVSAAETQYRADVAAAKDAALAAIEEAAGEEPWSEAMSNLVVQVGQALDAAATLTEVASSSEAGVQAAGEQYLVDVAAAKDAAKAAIEEAAGEQPWSEAMEAVVAEAEQAVDAEATLTEVEVAKDAGLQAAEEQYLVDVDEAKAAAKAAVEEAAGEQPWSEAVGNLVAEAEQTIDAAATLTEVAEACEAGVQPVGEQYAADVEAAKGPAKAAIETAAGEEPWSEAMAAVVAEAERAVDAAATLTEVAAAKDAGLQAAGEQYAVDVEAAKAAAKAELETAAGEEPWSEAMAAVVAEAEQAVDAVATLTEVAAAKDAGLPAVGEQYAADVESAKVAAKTAIEEAAGEAPWGETMIGIVADAEQAVDAAATLTEVAAAAEAGRTEAGDRYDYETLHPLYPEGDGGQFVAATKSSETFNGVLVDQDGVAGTIMLKLKKPNKRTGLFDVQAKVRTLVGKSVYSFRARKVAMPEAGALTLTMAGMNDSSKKHALVVVLEGDSLKGTFDGFELDGARDVLKLKDSAKRAAVAPFVGTWTGLFAGEGAQLAFSVKLGAGGKATVKVLDADGKSMGCSTMAEVGADGLVAVPVTVGRTVRGARRSFGFRLVFTADGVEAANVSPLLSKGKSSKAVAQVLGRPEFVAAGKPAATARSFKSDYALTVDPAAEAVLGPVVSNGAKLSSAGLITGKLRWSVAVVDTWGREKSKSVSGKVVGAMVGASGAGVVTVKLPSGETLQVAFTAEVPGK